MTKRLWSIFRRKVDDIAFMKLTNEDVVRHPLVQKIVKAYEEYESTLSSKNKAKSDNKTDRKKN